MPRRSMHRFFAPARGSLMALVASATALLGHQASAQLAAAVPGPGVSNSIQAGFDGAVMAAGGQPLLIDRLATSAIRVGERHVFAGFPLSLTESVDLEVVRVAAPGENLPAVVVGAGGVRRAVTAAPLEAFSGTVVGDPGSRVLLAIGEDGLSGIIETGGRRFLLTSGNPRSRHAPAAFDMASPQFQAIDWVPFTCALEGMPAGGGQGGGAGLPGGGSAAPAGAATCNAVELALDSDNEFLDLFDGNVRAALAYMQKLVFFASSIYDRDVQVQFDLSYWRLWEDTDPWVSGGSQGRLSEFRTYWLANEAAVHRDLTEMLSGGNLGGGVAFLDGVCNPTLGFGVNGNMTGFFPTPLEPSDQNWDIVVFTHEMGHNFDASHTHDLSPPPDCCFEGAGCPDADCATSNRGTIMSYCHLCSGGVSNIKLSFAPGNVTQITDYLNTVDCLSSGDCPNASSSCVAAVSPERFTVGKDGGCLSLTVVTNVPEGPDGPYSDPVCEWSVAGLPSWLSVSDAECSANPPGAMPSGNAGGRVTLRAIKNSTSADREAQFTVGGRTVTVLQRSDSACSLSLSTNRLSARATAGSIPIDRLVSSGCAWSATSDAAWLSIGPATGTSATTSATISFLANGTGTARTGTIRFLAAGQTDPADAVVLRVTQVQAGGCTYAVSPGAIAAGAEAGRYPVKLNASSTECAWTAGTDSSWLAVGPGGEAGSRAVYISVQENRTPLARTGKVYVAGQVVTVTQAAGPNCALGSVTLSSSTAMSEAGSGSKEVTVTPLASWCGWTASSNRSWLTVTPASGTGTEPVTIAWDVNRSSESRSGTVTIGNKTFTVTQLGISGTALIGNWKAFGGISAAGNSTRTMVVPQEAKSLLRIAYDIDYRTVGTSHLSELVLRVEVPGMPSRFLSVRPSATASPGTCQCSGSSATNLFGGGPFELPAGTAELKVFCYELADDGGPGQLDAFITQGTITLTFGTQQGCSYSVGETEITVPSGAGTGSLKVTTSASTCVWSATSNRSWLTVVSGGAGTGNLSYQYQRNPTAAVRSATITAAGKTITVTQPGTLPWSPHDLDAAKVWMRADEIPETSRAGGFVSRWPDLGPGGNSLTAAGSKRPAFVASGINGRPVVRFDGMDDTLVRGAVSGPGGGSAGGAVMVVRRVAAAAASASRPVAFVSTGNNAGVPRLSLSTGTLGRAVAQGRRPDSGALVSVTSSTAVPASAAQLQAAVLDSAAGKLTEYVNGLKVGESSLGSPPLSPSSVAAPRALRLGSTGAAGEKPFGGDIAEVIMLTGPLTDCQRRMLEGYLAHRWGFAPSLPASHPYRAAPPDSSNACE